MHRASPPARIGEGVPETATSKSFDVICAGDARWRIPKIVAASETLRWRSGGGSTREAWAGRDARTTLMILREIEVARCSLADLAVLGMSRAEVRAALRKNAVLVVSEEDGATTATGPFGEVSVVPSPEMRARLGLDGLGDAFTAAVCAALVRHGVPGESPSGMWHRVLRRGHAALATAVA